MSAEHFTVDGTLIEAWASLKSFRKEGEKPGRGDFRPRTVLIIHKYSERYARNPGEVIPRGI